jgi:regulatory LuxR family protein
MGHRPHAAFTRVAPSCGGRSFGESVASHTGDRNRFEIVTPIAGAGLQQQGDRGATEHQPEDGKTTSADPVPASRNPGRQKTSQAGKRYVRKGANKIMHTRERLTAKEMQVAALVWEGQTNREIAKAIGTTEQVVKNYLRNTFDKLGVWSLRKSGILPLRTGAPLTTRSLLSSGTSLRKDIEGHPCIRCYDIRRHLHGWRAVTTRQGGSLCPATRAFLLSPSS